MTSNTSQESQYIEMHKITGTSVNPQNEYLQNLHSLDQNRFIFLGTIIFDEQYLHGYSNSNYIHHFDICRHNNPIILYFIFCVLFLKGRFFIGKQQPSKTDTSAEISAKQIETYSSDFANRKYCQIQLTDLGIIKSTLTNIRDHPRKETSLFPWLN